MRENMISSDEAILLFSKWKDEGRLVRVLFVDTSLSVSLRRLKVREFTELAIRFGSDDVDFSWRFETAEFSYLEPREMGPDDFLGEDAFDFESCLRIKSAGSE